MKSSWIISLFIVTSLSWISLQSVHAEVFISKEEASEFLIRVKRSGIESECYEEVCSYEEVRECFGSGERTSEVWTSLRFQCNYNYCHSPGTSSCSNHYRGYSCSCKHSGYSGTNCNDVNECNSVSCGNGNCVNTDGSFQCSCNSGWSGTYCDADVNECNSVNCGNGNCVNTHGSYYCSCHTGWTGRFCNTDINECDAAPCLNDGTCTNSMGSFNCECEIGFIGETCQEIDDCISDPCENNATCTDRSNDFACHCTIGYTSKNCSIEIDECAVNPCENNATCYDLIGDFECDCLAGYTGKNCSIDIDDCESNPCANEATCYDLVDDYSCTCLPGYTDKNCSTDIDDCEWDPCENNGTCTDLVNDYNCSCVAGFTAKNCSIDIDDCASSPCENNGTCFDLVDDFQCSCVSGYIEKNCSVDFDDCSLNPCENNATCSDELDDFYCECEAGFTSKNCSINIDECAYKACTNGATCIDLIDDYQCNCVAGYTDKNCSTDIDDCASIPCMNSGSCSDLVNDYVCTCVAGYTDKNCSTDIDDCLSIPCQNNATCFDQLDDFSCKCTTGFTDKDCSFNIDDCAFGPCSNNGTCADLIDDYVCTCLAGYTGKNCTEDVNECDVLPCKNEANCSNLFNDYNCSCVAGYTDKNCSTDIDDCASGPCLFSAPCGDFVNDYTCQCPIGYSGKNCQTEPNVCKNSTCHRNAICIPTSTEQYRCECKPGFEGDGLECTPFCHGSTRWHNETNSWYTFKRASLYQSSTSNATCENERPLASAKCSPVENILDSAEFTDVKVLLCDVDLASVTAINNTRITTALLSSTIDNIHLLTSHANLSSDEVNSVADTLLAFSQSDPEQVEINPASLYNALAVINVVGRLFAPDGTDVPSQANAEKQQELVGVLQLFADRVEIPEDQSSLRVRTEDITLQVTEIKPRRSRNVKNQQNVDLTVDLPAVDIELTLKIVSQSKNRFSFILFNDDFLFQSEQNVSVVISTKRADQQPTDNPVKVAFKNETAKQGSVSTNGSKLTERVTRTQCVRWDKVQLRWISDGCSLVLGSSPPQCACDQLASFAMIVSTLVLPSSYVMGLFSYIGLSLSVIGLLLTVLLYTTTSQLRKRKPSTFLINICVCMTISNVVFMVGSGQTSSPTACYFSTALLHYFLLASWCWMTANAINMYQALVKVIGAQRSILTPAAIMSYVFPGVVVFITGGLTILHFDGATRTLDNIHFESSYHARHVCWLHLYSLNYAFLLPVGIMLLINFALFVTVLKNLLCSRTQIRSSAQKRSKFGDFMIAIAIIASMGVTWVFGFFMMVSDDVIYQSILAWLFTIFNSTQGILIFFTNCVRQRNVRDIWLQPLRKFFSCTGKEPSNLPTSKTVGQSQSTVYTKS